MLFTIILLDSFSSFVFDAKGARLDVDKEGEGGERREEDADGGS